MPRQRSPFGALAVLLLSWAVLRLALLGAGAEWGTAMTLRVGDARVSAIVFGDVASAGRPLVIAGHGGLASKETLLQVCWEARRRGADCAVIDELGHGASSALPRGGEGAIAAMRRALHVERALDVPAARVRYVGHSMGAYVGTGAVFPCERSVSVGQGIDCPEARIVWGDVHRALGLSDAFYLPVSHVLEPWTPRVVDEAVDLLVGRAAGSRWQIARRIALTWASFFVAMAAGVVGARLVRGAPSLVPASPVLRGFAGAIVMWLALVVGGWRTLWFLLPTQGSDWPIIAGATGATFSITHVLARMRLARPLLGVFVAAAIAEGLAIALADRYPHRDLAGLLQLPIFLMVPLAFVVASWERASRAKGISATAVESGAFTAAVLGAFLALLIPSW